MKIGFLAGDAYFMLGGVHQISPLSGYSCLLCN